MDSVDFNIVYILWHVSKVKVKVFPVLKYAPHHEDVLRE
jgi:hypothetical protein